jgi:cysteine desulfurase/selenocysteine lyase
MSEAARHQAATDSQPWDPAAIRDDFPALSQSVHGRPLVYLDSAATALKPQAVIDAVTQVYARDCGNIHRAVHQLSQRATLAFEHSRETVRAFLDAASDREIIFTRGTTEAINLVAQTWGRANLRPGDQILVTGLEHHSNIVPWQLLCQERGAELVVAPIDEVGQVPLEEFERRIGPRTRLVATAHVSNALGTIQNVAAITALAHERGALVLIDGAQAVPHLPVNVRGIGCDFYTFSSHKLYGPTGVGVLYGRRELLEAMPPYQGGGDMIKSVTFERTTYADLPHKFEAGTPDIAGVVGLGAAIDYVTSIGYENLVAHEADLLRYATAALADIPGLRLVGTAPHKLGVLSFTMDVAHPHDIGTIVDAEGVAIRTGHHCAQPVMERYGLPATARASLGMYNTRGDIDTLVRALYKVRELLG